MSMGATALPLEHNKNIIKILPNLSKGGKVQECRVMARQPRKKIPSKNGERIACMVCGAVPRAAATARSLGAESVHLAPDCARSRDWLAWPASRGEGWRCAGLGVDVGVKCRLSLPNASAKGPRRS